MSQRRHQLNSAQLTVEKLVARPPPPMISADVDDQKLLFTDLPVTERHHQQTRGKSAAAADDDEVSDHDENDAQKLKNFVQSAAGAEISHVTYSSERDKAVVSFATTPGKPAFRDTYRL